MNSRTKTRKKEKFKTFKSRLQFLVGEDKPYSWCQKIGIEKGLFQYYWQKGKIPKHENLIKISNFSGCSPHWLMTGTGDPFPDRIDDINQTINKLIDEMDVQIDKLEKLYKKFKILRRDLKSSKKGPKKRRK